MVTMNPPRCPWKALLLNASRENASSRGYIQLATVKSNGKPANRTIVFRGMFRPDHDTVRQTMIFTTDIRSMKVQSEIPHCAYGEICWYMPTSREQFRLAGRLWVVTAPNHTLSPEQLETTLNLPSPSSFYQYDWEDERLQTWRLTSPALRATFAQPTPGADKHTTEQLFVKEIHLDEEQNKTAETKGENESDSKQKLHDSALSNFCLLLLDVESVDIVKLQPFPAERMAYELVGAAKNIDCDDGEWIVRELNP